MPLSTATTPQRIAWIDVAKGLLIILVVIGHALNGLISADLIAPDGLGDQAYRLIYTFHMAAFFIISGYFSSLGIKKDKKSFLKKLVPNLVWPYFFWSLTQASIMGVFASFLNHAFTFDAHILRSLFFGHISQFWFLKTLFLIDLLYIVCTFFSLKSGTVLLIGFILYTVPSFLPPPETMQTICNYSIYFALGGLFADCGKSFKAPSWADLVSFVNPVLIGGAFFLSAFIAISDNNSLLAVSPLPISFITTSLLGSFFIYRLAQTPLLTRSALLAYLGKRSLTIYVMHVLCVAGGRIFFVNFLGITSGSIILPCIVAAGLFLPLAAFWVAQRLKILVWVGLR